jgi:nitrite reductase (NO-forming)
MTILFRPILIIAFPFALFGNIFGQRVATPEGKDLYKKYCLTCHQADGMGVSGMFPPLIKTPKVLGPADSLIVIVIYGLKGPAEVAGATYTQNMPAVKNITDPEIAEVLNYVRHSWGNKGTNISGSDVAKVRPKTEKKP